MWADPVFKEQMSQKRMGNQHRLGTKQTEETKRKISIGCKGHRVTDNQRASVTNANKCRVFSEETRRKLSKAHAGQTPNPKGSHLSELHRKHLSESRIKSGVAVGEKNPAWKGGISRRPYCNKWTEELRESIREEFGRKCYLCPKTETENGRKLAVHHINFDKNAGCYGRRFNLVPLCHRHHSMSTVHRFEYFNLLCNYWINKYIDFNNIMS